MYWLAITICWATPCVGTIVELLHINNDIVVETMRSWLVVETNKRVKKDGLIT